MIGLKNKLTVLMIISILLISAVHAFYGQAEHIEKSYRGIAVDEPKNEVIDDSVEIRIRGEVYKRWYIQEPFKISRGFKGHIEIDGKEYGFDLPPVEVESYKVGGIKTGNAGDWLMVAVYKDFEFIHIIWTDENEKTIQTYASDRDISDWKEIKKIIWSMH